MGHQANRGGAPAITTPEHIRSLLGRAQREAARAAGTGPVDREMWRQVVGERIANRTMVDRLEAGVLEVRVASSVWAQELSLLSAEMITRLKQHRVQVRRIRFKVGAVPAMDTAEPLAPPPQPVVLPEALKSRLAAVDDPELAAAIAEAARYSLARARQKK
jgi:predicted nucleic acid-binding Zn ribbon protein